MATAVLTHLWRQHEALRRSSRAAVAGGFVVVAGWMAVTTGDGVSCFGAAAASSNAHPRTVGGISHRSWWLGTRGQRFIWI